MVNLPWIVYGIITDSTGANPSGIRVSVRNDINGEIINVTTDSNGQYLADLANLTSGYKTTDSVTVVCAYGLDEGESSFDLADYTTGHQVDLTLATVPASSTTTYCEVGDVLDELGDKSVSDISYERVRKIILRAEAEIDERTGTKFSSTTVTDETHNFDQYTSWMGPEQMRGGNNDILVGTRNDYRNSQLNDKIRLEKRPVISVTSLSTNSASAGDTDSWTALTEQTGSGGDYVLESDTGQITFVKNFPALGIRKVKATYAYGYATVPKTVERLCMFLSVKDVITSKRTESQFDGSSAINLGGEISITKFDSPTYFNWLNEEIERLWKIVGDLIQVVA